MRSYSSPFASLPTKGIAIHPGFLVEADYHDLLDEIAAYRTHHAVPEVYREAGDRPLHYSVINGEEIGAHLLRLVDLYARVNELVNEAMGEELIPLGDRRVGLNVNVTSAGGTYRWHYDRNAVTAILYLNAVPGGETEIYPNYRLFMEGARYSALQRLTDRVLQMRVVRGLFGRYVQVAPEASLLVAMRGNRCLHSVRPVEGDADRVNVIMSYDLPGAQFAVAQQLDQYLYESEAASKVDPNYR